ncbi:MAG: tRNA pseudouridine(55) synthase TruB [Chlorobi bacterium]|nr:tRNA pseudouridine(55) synthase TruB [Chlorobiota bacterium]
MDFPAGEVLFIDKPIKWTSFDVVNKIRFLLKRYLGIKKIKVGHAGTLDPLATGLVIVCTGKFTKKIEEYQGMPKEYIAEISFGATTPTYDLESEPDEKYPFEHITKEMLLNALDRFTGEIEQTPPAYSAIKIKGRKAYELARNGDKVEMKSRKVTIYDIELLDYSLPVAKVKVKCSKGTYIRSLAYDIGKELKSGAYLSGLRRTQIGSYSVDDAIGIMEFERLITENGS